MVSLKVLGVELSRWSEVKQYLFITACIFAVQMMYGYTQEYIIMSIFQRKLALFTTLLQFGGYAFFSGSQRVVEGRNKRIVPIRYYVMLITMQAANLCFTNLSMQYVNFTTKVLIKSSKIIPIILFGAFYHKKRYPIKDYTAVALIVLGLLIFIHADAKYSPSYETLGVMLLCISLFLEGAVINIQEELMNVYCCQPSEYIYYMYMGGTSVMLGLTAWSGELWQGVEFLWERNDFPRTYLPIILFTLTGFLSTTFTAALVKHFGALVAALTTTMRRALTLMLSFVLFPKPIAVQHFVGWGIFAIGILTKAVFKEKPSKVS